MEQIQTTATAQFTCSVIPFPVVTEMDLQNAINNANDETTCPGPDVIDLGGRAITLTTALPQIIDNLTIQNGTIQRDSAALSFRLLYHNNPDGSLYLIDLVLVNGNDALGAALYTVGGLVHIEGTTFRMISRLT